MVPILDNTELTLEYARDHSKRNVLIKEILENPEFTGWVLSFVSRNGGSETDAQTVINDVVLNFIKNALKPEFNLKSSQAYLKGTAKNIWFQMFRKRKGFTGLENLPEHADHDTILTNLLDQEKKALLNQLLDKLGEDCKKVLTLWSYNMRMKEIAAKLNFGSEGYAKKRKHICMKRLLAIAADNKHLLTQLKTYE